MKKKETVKKPVPVMKQLARPISKEELASVSGTGSYPLTRGASPADFDEQN